MTSGTFKTVPVSEIFFDDAVRQRQALEKIEELAQSIQHIGLINPPVITPEGQLIAGRRRIAAVSLLGWTHVPVQLSTDLSEIELHVLELEENVKRVDLTWQEQTAAIARYHELRAQQTPGWTQQDTANALGISTAQTSKQLMVAEALEKKPEIAGVDKLSTAINIATRQKEREKEKGLRDLLPHHTPAEKNGRPVQLLNVDFLAWAKTTTQQFNVIHCDFPYGVKAGDKIGQSAAKEFGTYEDTPDVYWQLLDALCTASFVAPSAHLIFWFSMKFYEPTREKLLSAGWAVDPFPFIWHKSDNAGIIPDPNRGPRRTYETALFASRGDRKIVKPVANSFSGPTTKEFHSAEKSLAMLDHFFRMIVDHTSLVLDPTCGSGMAIKAAEAAGASFSLGLEKDPKFFEGARKNLSL